MRTKLTCLALAIMLTLTLTACGCMHKNWVAADCARPKTCAECGETEGSPLVHSWLAATCETPKTCENCGLIEGEALGHFWMDATTEAPKTCSNCGKTEGERIITDARFTTEATKALYGTWVCRIDIDGTLMDLNDFSGTLPVDLILELTNSGEFNLRMEVGDTEAFYQSMKVYMMDTIYAELAATGLDKAAADEAIKTIYGMTTEEYVDYTLDQLDFNSLFGAFKFKMVYYVEGNTLYTADTWSAPMTSDTFTLNGDTLTFTNIAAEIGYAEGDLTFTRETK